MNLFTELEKLKKRIFHIYDQTTAIINTYEDITNIFENIIAVVKDINDLQPHLRDIFKSILFDTQENMEINLKTVNDFEQQQAENIVKLNECHKQLNIVKEELHHSTESVSSSFKPILKINPKFKNLRQVAKMHSEDFLDLLEGHTCLAFGLTGRI